MYYNLSAIPKHIDCLTEQKYPSPDLSANFATVIFADIFGDRWDLWGFMTAQEL